MSRRFVGKGPIVQHKIAVIPGDGIGKEVMPEAIRVLDAAANRHDFRLAYTYFDWSAEEYARTGRMMPEDGIGHLAQQDAILLGAVGWPSVPDHVSLWGLLIPIRRTFEQYVNLRPVRMLRGLRATLANGRPDYWVVRENTEGEYSQLGGRFGHGADETAIQVATFSRRGVDRIIRYAFDLAKRLGRPHVTSVTKSNGLFHSMPFWDERFRAVQAENPDVRSDQFHIDNLAAQLVMAPERFDIIVGSNLFGDIISDLGPGTTGTLGMAPSANLDPTRRYPSMFEPVHGSAPDIAGKGLANPIGQIWAASMMLDHLGEQAAGASILAAIEAVIASEDGPKTRDIGGVASTQDVGERLAAVVSG
jgi:tartrate dehydrogenase/decarboxylase/D-malate dehydrogenase